jgi:hypothetical protein
MGQEEIRKQFEAWADENHYALDRSDINKEIYRNILTRNALLGYLAGYQAALASKQCEISHLKFKIDSLMLEFCPSEMTQEQVENWAEHQKKINARIEQNIKKSVTTVAMREDLKDAVCFANDGKERDWTEQENIESNQDAGLKAMLEYSRETGNAFIYQPKAIEPAQDNEGRIAKESQ